MEKIKKIEINLFPEETTSESAYNKARADFISKTTKYVPGGFLSMGDFVPDPLVGEATWNKTYPNGYKEWRGAQRSVNAYGQQAIIDKINEIIEFLNK